jgi:hypothetical protein
MIRPAVTKRDPVRSSGGIVSRAIRIARYVVPQTTQTMAKAV